MDPKGRRTKYSVVLVRENLDNYTILLLTVLLAASMSFTMKFTFPWSLVLSRVLLLLHATWSNM